MKKLSSFIIALVLVMAGGGTAVAHRSDGLEGLLLGGASGALVGQAIGRNPEAVIVGSVIGSTLGLLIDLGSSRHHAVVIDRPRQLPRAGFVYSSSRQHRPDRWDRREYRRHDRRWRQHDRRDHRR